MAYIDDKMKKLLKKRAEATKESSVVAAKREIAHNNIQKALAQAILKGSYLSQEIWTLPGDWIHNTHQNNFSLIMASPIKQSKARWGSILTYMNMYCYKVALVSGISLTFREDEGFEIIAEDNERLSKFVKKYGLQIVCPDADAVAETLNDKLDFIKRIRNSFKTP